MYGAFDLVMPPPATFCTFNNELFHPDLDDWWYTLIVVYSHSLNDHVSHLRTIY